MFSQNRPNIVRNFRGANISYAILKLKFNLIKVVTGRKKVHYNTHPQPRPPKNYGRQANKKHTHLPIESHSQHARLWKWRLWANCAVGYPWGDVVDFLFKSLCEKPFGVGGSSLAFGFEGLPSCYLDGGCRGPLWIWGCLPLDPSSGGFVGN